MQPTVEITQEILDSLDEDHRQHQFIPVRAVEFHGNQVRITNDETGNVHELMINEDARDNLASFVGAPSQYLAKMDDPDLFQRIWNHHLSKRRDDINVLQAVADINTVKMFAPRTFHSMPPSHVVQACREVMPDAVFERQPNRYNRSVEFYITNPDLYENFAADETVGCSDIHHFSVGVQYDYAGGSSPSMKTYGHRHNCGNITEAAYGVSGKQFRIYTTDPQQMLAKFGEYTRQGMEFVRMKLIPHIRATMETRLADPMLDIQDLVNKHNMPERVSDLLFEAYRAEHLGDTTYHLINAVTRAANSDRCPPEWVNKLRQIAGIVTVDHDPQHPVLRCDACHQVRTTGSTRRKHRH